MPITTDGGSSWWARRASEHRIGKTCTDGYRRDMGLASSRPSNVTQEHWKLLKGGTPSKLPVNHPYAANDPKSLCNV